MQHDDIVRAALERIVAALEEAREELDELDAVADDGNHGTHMLAGASAARDAAASAPAGTALAAASQAWGAEEGSANSLWGAMGAAAAAALPAGPLAMVDAALQALETSTDASIGDKSIVDTLAPALGDAHVHLRRGEPGADAAAHAAGVAEEAAVETAAIEDRFDASTPDLGFPDPGATSSAVILAAIADVLAEHS
ncbi:DAK2 domain-containing protein [Agrococcus carbonis]|uniref:DAK2 domain-containing protein n=1 Tax=Agrococcus carbonis TaxID=684552 RepID=A0A1H1RVF5_9MICO|nr:DAK2 domain-containing protein [Agrococcus carbonis]SDS39645.1 DAK2 domain-containing protein [Agrococcus carbonis]